MFDFTAALVGIIALSLAISLVLARRPPSQSDKVESEPVGYTFTVWAEKGKRAEGERSINRVQPQKITAEYSVLLQAHSPEELDIAQRESARWAMENFRRHFAPVLGQIDIGAVHCEPDAKKED